MKPWARRVLLAGGALAVTSAAYAKVRWDRMVKAQTPTFTEVPSGPRAPSRSAAAIDLKASEIGSTRLPAILGNMSLEYHCEDRSMSTIVREGVAAAVKTKEAAGENALTYRIYGWLNPHGRNPQVRLDCQRSAKSAAKESASSERVLYVFDGKDAPLRHVSRQRSFHDSEEGITAYLDAATEIRKQFGNPKRWEDPTSMVAMDRRKAMWDYADLHVEVVITNLGKMGTSLSETVEVP
ncbi:MAG: hypothetical protein KBF88_06710, partial [Polyangiaceae bacterium]|nr:hypothetical protein [Polyangiaceae bacterium]